MEKNMAMLGILAALIITMIGAAFAHNDGGEDYGYGMMDAYRMMGSPAYGDMMRMAEYVPAPGTYL